MGFPGSSWPLTALGEGFGALKVPRTWCRRFFGIQTMPIKILVQHGLRCRNPNTQNPNLYDLGARAKPSEGPTYRQAFEPEHRRKTVIRDAAETHDLQAWHGIAVYTWGIDRGLKLGSGKPYVGGCTRQLRLPGAATTMLQCL